MSDLDYDIIDLPNLEGQTIGRYKISTVLGEPGAFGITYKAHDTKLDAPVAIKFLKSKCLDPNWKLEARKASRLRNVPEIVQIYDFDEENLILNGKQYKLHFLVWEFIDGTPLKKYLENNEIYSAEFIIAVIEQLCYAVKAMHDLNLEHGDLHPGNIMVIPPKEYEPQIRYRLKVIDFGLAKTFDSRYFKNDMDFVTDILKTFWSRSSIKIENISIIDKKFNLLIPNLIKQLEDTSVERKLVDPIETINKLHDILATTHITTNEEIGKLKSPFEYLSAEEMPENNDLLYFLYSTNLPWLRNIENFGNMIISGPRGCGKSMILKNLRWQTKLTSKEYRNENFSKDHYIGFYLHCHHALYLPFAGIYIDYSKTEIQEAFIHYINLLFTHEVIQTLKIVEGHNILDFTDSFKEKLVDFIEKNVLTTKIALLENVNMFSYLSTIIEKKTTYIQKCIIESKIPTKLSRLNYINELCNLLINNIPYFREKKIYFILDDYSHPKVRFEIQKAFNRILGVRNSLYCFKISSEKFSFVPSDYDLDGVKKTFQQDREFSYTDLGGKYLTYKKDIELRNFIELIINKRIERCSELNSKDTESIFGNFELPLGGIPNALIIDRNYRKGKKKRRSEKRQILYAGIKSIYSLCGGDIATILQLCKEIYDIAVNSQRVNLTSENIPFEIQDRVIKEFSKRRLERIKEIFNWGQKCYDIIESFGEISKAYLYNYGKITKEKNRYYEVMKIEITDSGQLNDEAHELYKTLIQEGIFTDEGGKYPWGKGILNNSLVLRPIYTPALQISYRRRECLRMSTLKFSQFMLYPKNFRKIGTKFLKDHLGHTTELLREIDDLPLFEKKN